MVAEASETYVPDFDMDLDAPLQDILRLPEPFQSATLARWLEVYDDVHGGEVLIKTKDGTATKLPFKTSDGTVFNVPPRGRRIPRRLALRLLEMFGPSGTYTNMDMRSGMTRAKWEVMGAEEIELWEKKGITFNFNENYLIHVRDQDAIADVEEEVFE